MINQGIGIQGTQQVHIMYEMRCGYNYEEIKLILELWLNAYDACTKGRDY